MGSSRARDRTRVSRIVRWIPNHSAPSPGRPFSAFFSKDGEGSRCRWADGWGTLPLREVRGVALKEKTKGQAWELRYHASGIKKHPSPVSALLTAVSN